VSKALVLRSLAELADYFPSENVPPPFSDNGVNAAEAATSPAALSTIPAEAAESLPDLGALLAQIAQASTTVASLTQQDQEARQTAHSLLERYEALSVEVQAAEQAWNEAQEVRQAAECLAVDAFAELARTAAHALLPMALQAETTAARLVEQRRTARDCLAAEPALERLLEERRREGERQMAQAAAAERTRQLGEGLAALQAALAAGRLQEAEAMLGTLAKDHPDSAQVTSLQYMIRQRLAAVKIGAAEEALRDARRSYRHAPADAIGRLERVDLQDLPEQVLQQVKGVWAAACARVCKERQATAFLRYLPQPAYGVVIAREAAGEYRVISALGAAHLQAGTTVDETFVRRAHPLRASGR
jgi:hypothetical protein